MYISQALAQNQRVTHRSTASEVEKANDSQATQHLKHEDNTSVVDIEQAQYEGNPEGNHSNEVGSVERVSEICSMRQTNSLLVTGVTRANVRVHLGCGECSQHGRLLRVRSWVSVCTTTSLGALALRPAKEMIKLHHEGFSEAYLSIYGAVLDRIDKEA